MPTSLRTSSLLMLLLILQSLSSNAQLLQLPDGGINLKSSAGRRLGVTDIDIRWNAPGVKGREGKIWGTDIAPYGFNVLGFGSYVESPWRAGANECTTISFSTDVRINGKLLPAGNYAFFIALYPDSCVLIFNKNTSGWGSYFYNSQLDVLRVSTKQEKDLKESKERLDYTFSKHTAQSIEVALEWERWRIPFSIEVDLKQTTLASIRSQMSGAMGFDPPSLEAAANWCMQNQVNQQEALNWITSATDPALDGVKTFRALSTRSGLLAQLNRTQEADSIMKAAMANASATELHQYGRQLMASGKKAEAMAVFEQNYHQQKGAWPTNVGMMRGYSAMGNLAKALEHAKLALPQAPNEENRKVIELAIKQLSDGKPL